MTSFGGHRLYFYSRIVDVMPDNLVCDLVAHELGHVWQRASGIRFKGYDSAGVAIHEDRCGERWLPGELEEDADVTMETWGFDPYAMDRWALAQGIACRRSVTFSQAVRHHDRFMKTGRR
jgi:hypothetical protein